MTPARARVIQGVAGAAVMISVVTLLARATGFLRIAVFARTEGVTCLAGTYITANTIPNIVFDVVAGGALASLVVPLLAGPVVAGETEHVRRTASALLTWTLVVLVPIAVIGIFFVRPIMELLVGHLGGSECNQDDVVDIGSRMLLVFLPQIPLYGVGIVLAGILQSHRRFLGPALAPLLSSVVVITAYLVYGAERGPSHPPLDDVPLSQQLTLSIGTTLGVVVLSLSLLIPLRRTGVRLRPTLSFPPGVAVRVRRLAYAGAAALAAQQLTALVALRLANSQGTEGAALLYTLAWTVFLLPWAILAVPIATSAFPTLSAQHERGSEGEYATTAAETTRAVILVTAVAAAAIAATADPIARVLIHGTHGASNPEYLARAIALFAPGVIGFALVAHVGRALYARRRNSATAFATVIGWAVAVAFDVVLVNSVDPEWTVAAIAAGTSIGMTAAGVLLVVSLRRSAGAPALAGLTRAVTAALVGGGLAFVAGRIVVDALDVTGAVEALGSGALAGAAALLVYAGVVLALDGSDLRALPQRLRRRPAIATVPGE